MSRSKKKAAASSDTITFKKTELLAKIKTFLEEENACNGDWLNKVKVQLLGMEESNFEVKFSVPITLTLSFPSEGTPTKEEIAAHVNEQIELGEYHEFDNMDANQHFVVESVKRLPLKK